MTAGRFMIVVALCGLCVADLTPVLAAGAPSSRATSPAGSKSGSIRPVEMYQRKIEPQAVRDVLAWPQLMLSLLALLVTLAVGIVLRRILSRAGMSPDQRQALGPTISLVLLGSLLFALALIWQTRLQAIQIVFGALAVGLARGLVGVTKPLTAFWLRIRQLRRGALVRVGNSTELAGRVLRVNLSTTTLAVGSAEDAGEQTGAIVVLSNGLLYRHLQLVDTQHFDVRVLAPPARAAAVAQRLERAAALTLGGARQVLRRALGEQVELVLELEAAPGALRRTRDHVLTRYLELEPSA